MSQLVVVLFLAVLATAIAQIPCDDAYGAHCPEASGYGVGDCLKALSDQESLSKECLAFIELHDQCKEDIDTHCTGKEYTGDALVCLAEWTKPDQLSEQCKSALPKKEEKKRNLSASQKKKAEKRRKIRSKAAKMAREF